MSADIETIRDAMFRMHRVATGQSDRAYMSIPADPSRDADLILSAAIDELERLRAQRDELAEALRSALDGASSVILWLERDGKVAEAQLRRVIDEARAALAKVAK